MNQNAENGGQQRTRSRAAKIALIGFLAIAAFYLVAEHRAHLWGWLPFLIILACPLLHMFMHGKHGDHSGHTDRSSIRRSKHVPHDH